jgi:predicted dehydrogenase
MHETRRQFLTRTGLATVVAASAVSTRSLLAADPPSERVRVGVIGLGRGLDHVNALLQVPHAQVAFVCDVDERRALAAAERVEKQSGKRPAIHRDLRKLLEESTLDAVSIALPNFWHAPATILACAAGKHVYVEKPGSHNAREGELMVAAAAKYKRQVQMGNQRRSTETVRQAVEELRGGVIGKVRFARCWYNNARATIGRGKPAPVPDWLDYALWQGPAPERPYVDNLVHYNWHWRWHWGGGELANNGIHTLDLARWGLGVEYPRHVSCTGGRYHFEDDQETPDTQVATFDFGTCGISWDGSSCQARKSEKESFVTWYGDDGSLALESSGSYRIYDPNGKERGVVPGRFSDVPHFANFVEAIRTGEALNSPIAEGQKSTLLCHLGNLAWRTTGAVTVDAKTGRLIGATNAQRPLWGREYRKGWEPKV